MAKEDYFNFFDENGIHKFTNTKYDFNGFDKYGKHKDTEDIYDTNGFDKYGKHKDTEDIYDTNGFNTNGLHKDTNTFFNKEKNIRKDILKNINLLKDRDEFFKLYDEIIKNGEFIVDTKTDLIKSGIFKKFLEDILSGNIKCNEVEKKLNNSMKSENNDIIKNYIKKINYLLYEKDKKKA